MLKELEDFRRIQKKNFILQQKRRIGYYHKSKHLMDKSDWWEDGEEVATLK